MNLLTSKEAEATKESSVSKLNLAKVLEILQPEGALSRSLKGFESRIQQQKMTEDIINAYNHDAIALIEAGTGTGKSLAYLIPAILWAKVRKERTVISTNTISLQEQLIQKDIPFLLKALNLDIKPVLVKGMGNYLCLRKLEETSSEILFLTTSEAEEVKKIEAWSHHTKEGSRSSLPFIPSGPIWEKVAAESDTCNSNECPHFQACHFFKARREASEANLLIVNHHLLFADLARRAETNNYADTAILPLYHKIVLDESHHIEDIATEYFANHVSQLKILKILGRLATEKGSKSLGKLPILKEKIQNHYRQDKYSTEVSDLLGFLTMDLPGSRRDLVQHVTDTFSALSDFVDILSPSNTQNSESKLRLKALHYTHPRWTSEIMASIQNLMNSLKKYIQMLYRLDKEVLRLDDEKLTENTKSLRFEVNALADRLSQTCTVLEEFIKPIIPPNRVRWIEIQKLKSILNIHLVDAKLDVAKSLVDFLFSKFPTVILCSATLATNKQFQFVKRQLGLTEDFEKNRRVIENIYDSPFNYHQQALFAIVTDIPDSSSPDFYEIAVEAIWQAIQASHGNAFVLFTSYSMLKTCYEKLIDRLNKHRYTALKQGDTNRQALLTRFKSTDRSVLFGTDSFWEGVDVVGDALRCVIIVKLPFKVPSEPIIEARAESIFANGGDPFLEYSLPHAIVKFKQGFGRLIRHKRDRGCIVCLDSRLSSKNYGKQFFNSLPSCQQVLIKRDQLSQQMVDFYKKTYYLTKGCSQIMNG